MHFITVIYVSRGERRRLRPRLKFVTGIVLLSALIHTTFYAQWSLDGNVSTSRVNFYFLPPVGIVFAMETTLKLTDLKKVTKNFRKYQT